MSVDFAALAMAVVSGVPDVRTCLVVSRDGLALGAYPVSEEEKALAVWSRMAALGDVERGFVALRDEVWVFCRRGPYTALATGRPSLRVGVLLDRLDQMLLAAEEARVRKEEFRPGPEREAGGPDAPRGPRTSLHPAVPEEVKEFESVQASSAPTVPEVPISAWVERLRAQALSSTSLPPGEPTTQESSPPVTAEAETSPEQSAEAEAAPEAASEEEQAKSEEPRGGRRHEIDTASLSREFAGLLMEGRDDERER